jgi:NAD(P)-dependent dehydrogenase (short-subunit alcohol dehydrogenase family)
MGLLEGKVAAITGAGGGIGRAHALLFAAEGACVVVNDLGGSRDGSGSDASAADQVVAEIIEAGGKAIANHDDVTNPAVGDNLVKAAVDEFGKLDIMLNNAGILRDKTLRKMTQQMWATVVDVHLNGAFYCTQAAALHMIERGEGGRIINTSSVSGLMGNFGQSNYAAAKAGIYGFTRTVSMELKKYRVTCNALAPVALTRMTADLPVMQAMPNAKGLLGPENVAPAALFLASDLAADITGAILAVEGPRMSIFKMTQSSPVLPTDEDTGWSAQEILDRWGEITGSR